MFISCGTTHSILRWIAAFGFVMVLLEFVSDDRKYDVIRIRVEILVRTKNDKLIFLYSYIRLTVASFSVWPRFVVTVPL
jgi:hypothetical protein